jgi:hypothetical protein
MTNEERTAYWRGLVDEQAQSGLSAAAFCRNNDLKIPQFYRWRCRFRASRDLPASSGFLALIPTSDENRSGVRIRLDAGVSIEVDRGFDPPTLRKVVETIR